MAQHEPTLLTGICDTLSRAEANYKDRILNFIKLENILHSTANSNYKTNDMGTILF